MDSMKVVTVILSNFNACGDLCINWDLCDNTTYKTVWFCDYFLTDDNVDRQLQPSAIFSDMKLMINVGFLCLIILSDTKVMP